MESTKESIHAFIVRLWVEPREVKEAEPIWRGAIQQVGDGSYMYFDHLDELSAYFAGYLERVMHDTRLKRHFKRACRVFK